MQNGIPLSSLRNIQSETSRMPPGSPTWCLDIPASTSLRSPFAESKEESHAQCWTRAASPVGFEGCIRESSRTMTCSSTARSPSPTRQAGMVPGRGTCKDDSLSTLSSGKLEDPSVESLEPTRHFWIGNLGPQISRAVLKAVFDQFGMVEDVVTFPGRMYAFVNFRLVDEAKAAHHTLQGLAIPELTGDRPLLLKYRPATKAEARLRALGLSDGDEASIAMSSSANQLHSSVVAPIGTNVFSQQEPTARIWLGNISVGTTVAMLQSVLSRFGPLLDAAVFPARIGPLGYAFARFERIEDAMVAFHTLNNTVVPALSGGKQLKMRYKSLSDAGGPENLQNSSSAVTNSGKSDGTLEARGPAPAVTVSALAPMPPAAPQQLLDNTPTVQSVSASPQCGSPSRHLWLGNVSQRPSDVVLIELFSPYGRVDSVRVFGLKAYAFINFADVGSARRAMAALDGAVVPAVTGLKPLVMRFQQEPLPIGSGAAAAAAAVAARMNGRGLADMLSTLLGPHQAAAVAAAAATLGPHFPMPSHAVPSTLTPSAPQVHPPWQNPSLSTQSTQEQPGDLLGTLSRLLETLPPPNVLPARPPTAGPSSAWQQRCADASASPVPDKAAIAARLACLDIDASAFATANHCSSNTDQASQTALDDQLALLKQLQATVEPSTVLGHAFSQASGHSTGTGSEMGSLDAATTISMAGSARQTSMTMSPDGVWALSPMLVTGGSPDMAELGPLSLTMPVAAAYERGVLNATAGTGSEPSLAAWGTWHDPTTQCWPPGSQPNPGWS